MTAFRDEFASLMAELDAEQSSSAGVHVRHISGIAVVTLSNTRRRNAMGLSMWRRLEEIFTGLAGDRTMAAVLVRGAGTDAFAAGADISEFPEQRHDIGSAAGYNAQLARTLRALAGLELPTIAAIQGFAVGGGCELSHACDLRLASPTAQIGIPIGKLGVILGVTEAKYLVRHIGVNGLKRVLYSGRLFDAAESLRMGLVDEVPEAAFWDAVGALLEAISNSRAATMRAAKVITDMAADLNDVQGDKLQEMMMEAYGGKGLREGFEAFLEKRTPDFSFERRSIG